MKADRPGCRRLLAELVEWAEARDGALPQRKSLANYSKAELKDILLALPRAQLGREGAGYYVRVRDHYLQEYGSTEKFLEDACQQLGRPFHNHLAQKRHAIATALDLLAQAPLADETRGRLTEGTARGRGWVIVSLQEDGPVVTKERLEKLGRLLTALPAPGEEPLRQYCAHVLRDSHALDEDETLRVALDSEIAYRHPEIETLDAAYRMEGVLQHLTYGVVLAVGPLVLATPAGQLDFRPMAAGRIPFALTEAQLEAAALAPTLPRAIVFVENPSAWYPFAKHAPDDILCVLTDGMPTKACQAFCLIASKTNVPLLHWGDVDVGGLQILDLMRSLSPVRPFLMDTDSLQRFHPYLSPFKAAKRIRFEAHRVRPEIAVSLDMDGWLEQETVPLDLVIKALELELAPSSRVAATDRSGP